MTNILYFCKRDVNKGIAYDILRGPIFRNWPASGFSDFQNGVGYVSFKHKSGASVIVRKKEARKHYNIEVSINGNVSERQTSEVFRDLSEALNIRLVTRRFYVR